MVHLDRAMPGWVNKWLMVNTAILTMDGGFCVLRPHSFPDGCLSYIFYGYKWYIEADKHYADPKDSFIFTQGLGNLVEATLSLLILLNVFKTARLTKLVTMLSSAMTFYKTFLFCIYSLDIGQGGRSYQGFVAEFLIFGLGCVWLIFPAATVWVLLQDFVEIGNTSEFKGKRSNKHTGHSAEDTVDGVTSSRQSPGVYNLRKKRT